MSLAGVHEVYKCNGALDCAAQVVEQGSTFDGTVRRLRPFQRENERKGRLGYDVR